MPRRKHDSSGSQSTSSMDAPFVALAKLGYIGCPNVSRWRASSSQRRCPPPLLLPSHPPTNPSLPPQPTPPPQPSPDSQPACSSAAQSGGTVAPAESQRLSSSKTSTVIRFGIRFNRWRDVYSSRDAIKRVLLLRYYRRQTIWAIHQTVVV